MTSQSGKPRKHSVHYWVYALASSLTKGSMRFYGAKFGIRVPEMRILSTLGTYGMLASRDIVALTAMDKALVSRVLAGLANRGYVEILPTAADARLRRWRLTRSGQTMVGRLRPVWKEREARIQEGLTEEERQLLLDLLGRLFQASEKLRAEEAGMLAERIEHGAKVSAGSRR